MAADKHIFEPCETFHKAVNFDAAMARLFSALSCAKCRNTGLLGILVLLLTGCGTFGSFEPRTKTVLASHYAIHIISDYYSNAYLIESENGLVLVDTGAKRNDKKIVGKIKEITNKDLKLIFITHAHFDHYGSAKALRKTTGAPICVYKDDAEAMTQGRTPLPKVRKWGYLVRMIYPLHQLFDPTPKTNPDVLAVDGMELDAYGVHARIVHLPGHTPGSSILVLEGKYAFVGDLFANKSRVRVQDLYADDWGQISESVRAVKAMNLERVFPGHGEPFEAAALESVK
jgi:hydroxyacylglutathione hydrolase